MVQQRTAPVTDNIVNLKVALVFVVQTRGQDESEFSLTIRVLKPVRCTHVAVYLIENTFRILNVALFSHICYWYRYGIHRKRFEPSSNIEERRCSSVSLCSLQFILILYYEAHRFD